jgi:hypothetical protein
MLGEFASRVPLSRFNQGKIGSCADARRGTNNRGAPELQRDR